MEKTYSIYWNPSANLTMADCKQSDKVGAGMLEQVLPDLIAWHDVPASSLPRVLDYVTARFGHLLVGVHAEEYQGSYCNLVCVCGYQL